MYKHYLVAMFLIFLSSSLTAQKWFNPGYVKFNSGDSLIGLIENRSYYENSIMCRFLFNTTDSVKNYTPSDLAGYRFTNGKYYVSKTYNEEKVFLEFLIKGKLNVYFRQTKDGENHFYLEKDTLPLRELVYYSQVILDDEGVNKIYKSSTHNRVLAYYTKDYSPLQDRAMNLGAPNTKNLINFAKTYHNAVCKDQACEIFEKKSRLTFELEASYMYRHLLRSNRILLPPSNTSAGSIIVSAMIPQLSESIFFGAGVNFYSEQIVMKLGTLPSGSTGYVFSFEKKFQFPFTVYYNNHKQGLSPVAGLKMNQFLEFNAEGFAGINYQIKNYSLKLTGTGGLFSTPSGILYNYGARIGIAYLFSRQN